MALMERALAARGICVATVTSDDDGPGRRNGKPCGVPLAENGATRRYFRRQTGFYKASLSMARWLRCNAADYDLLHIHALFSFSTLAAVRAARRAGVPYILRPLGTLSTYGVTQRRPWLKRLSLAWLEGPALRHAAAVHFTSADELREAAQWGIPMRGVVIPLGVEAAATGDNALVRAHFPALGQAPYLLYLSRLDPKKNVAGLLQALRKTLDGPAPRPAKDVGGVKLLIAGDGNPAYVAQLHALAADLGLSGSVVWAGHVAGDLKASALAGATAFVLPSFSENFGIAAAEALMAGLPCVLGQGVAISQDVVNAGAGVAVTTDPASIAAGLQQVLADESGRVAMADAARRLAQDKYSEQAMGARLVALYEAVATGKPTGLNISSAAKSV